MTQDPKPRYDVQPAELHRIGGCASGDDGHDTDGMHGADREYYESITDGLGCGIVGRNMYDAAGAWGGTNPFPGTLIVLTHRTEDQPDPSAGFLFVDGFDAALLKARELAGDGGVSLGGGADLIRQGLAAGVVDELAISTAPLVLGGGKRLFEGFEQDIDLEVLGTWSSQYATHVRYAVRRARAGVRRALTTARLRHDATPKEDPSVARGLGP